MQQATSDDVLEFGMIPELVGRLPVTCPLKPLDTDALVRVLHEPKNAVIKQYQKLFEMENSELIFTPEALRAIAERAQTKGTGARGLRAIIEEVMLDVMYELPEQTPGQRYLVTPEIVQGKQRLFPVPDTKTKSA